MKRLPVYIALLFFLLIPANALADTSDTIGQLYLGYRASASPVGGIIIYSPELADFSLGGGGAIDGTFTNAVSSLVCLNAACTKLSFDLDISGITLRNVPFGGTVHSTLFFPALWIWLVHCSWIIHAFPEKVVFRVSP